MNIVLEFNTLFQVHEQFLKFCEMDDFEWPKGENDYFKVTGHDLTEVPIGFWYTLKESNEASTLIKALAYCGGGCSSKVTTMEEAIEKFEIYHSIVYFANVFAPIAAGRKADYFPQDFLLIDDSDEEIEAWQGPKILIPKPWNSGTGDPLAEITRLVRA